MLTKLVELVQREEAHYALRRLFGSFRGSAASSRQLRRILPSSSALPQDSGGNVVQRM
jgi:hypothetical protein